MRSTMACGLGLRLRGILLLIVGGLFAANVAWGDIDEVASALLKDLIDTDFVIERVVIGNLEEGASCKNPKQVGFIEG